MRPLTAKDYVALPWQWAGPIRQEDGAGDSWFEIRIRELPDFMVAGATREAAIADAAEALEAFVASYLERGESPPLPAAIQRPDGTAVVPPFDPALAAS